MEISHGNRSWKFMELFMEIIYGHYSSNLFMGSIHGQYSWNPVEVFMKIIHRNYSWKELVTIIQHLNYSWIF